jgi:nitrite reductase/ring-hydroxylating ferredoxin subunit
MDEHIVADADDLGEGERLLIELKGRPIGIFNVDGEYRAYANWCAHQGGPVCEGALTGEQAATFDRETLETELEWTRDGEMLVCPWHGWQYDLVSGECPSRPGRQLPEYPVSIEDGKIVVRV